MYERYQLPSASRPSKEKYNLDFAFCPDKKFCKCWEEIENPWDDKKLPLAIF